MTISVNSTKTMKALVRDLARHQKAGHQLESSDFMLDLAGHLDFEALERILDSHLDLITVTTYFRDMAVARIIPRDVEHVRPVLAAGHDARHQYRDRQHRVKLVR